MKKKKSDVYVYMLVMVIGGKYGGSERESRFERRRRFKSRNFAIDCQRQRRQATLERQRASRRDITETLRHLASSSSGSGSSATTTTKAGENMGGSSSSGKVRQQQQQQQRRGFRPWKLAPLAMPEWLLEVPEHLATDWYVLPRVDGKRCIVVAHNGSTTIRSRHGAFLRRGGGFPSPLPGGCRSNFCGGKGGMTILDCIYPEQNHGARRRREKVFVLDVMMWNGKDMYDCSAEFRFFWLQSTLNDVLSMYDEGDDIISTYPVDFRVLPYFEADREGILNACDAEACNLSVNLDGLLFYLREGPYMLGVTPLILIWKDGATSYHFIETVPEPPPENVPVEDLPLVVSLCGRKTEHDTIELMTSDNPPMSLGEVDLMWDTEEGGRLLRFKVMDTFKVSKGDHDLQLEYLEMAGKSRAQADSWSRIEFQCRARHRPLTMGEILNAAASSST